METLAAVMTGSGTSAIATFEVFGPQAHKIITHIFTPYGDKPVSSEKGSIQVGTLHDHNQPIDQITLGCEGLQHMALHCHGNPLIVERAMALLEAQGVRLVSPETIQARQLAATSLLPCQQEAKLALGRCKSLLGAFVLNHQIQEGLTTWAQQTFDTLGDLRTECRIVLDQSHIAGHILNGVTVALIGPPNSGKSTLLNSLSGQDAAIVTHIAGTTRDWVEADCRTDALLMHLIDTAGLDTLLQQDHLDKESQQRTLSVLDRADLILLILDNNQPATQIELHWLGKLPNIPRITVLNKSDLPSQLNLEDLDLDPEAAIKISARNETGLNELLAQIEKTLQVKDFDFKQPLCVTPRQQQCLENILAARTLAQAQEQLKQLLNVEQAE